MLICFGARVSIIHSVVSNCGSLFTSGGDEYFQFNPMLIVAGAVFTDMDTRASLCGGQFHFQHHYHHHLAAVCKGVSPKLFLRSGRQP